MDQDPKDSKNTPYALLLDWLWVGIPLAWGVSETVLKAKALFR
jgi:hypothetical protein